jgi:hypothetical protein
MPWGELNWIIGTLRKNVTKNRRKYTETHFLRHTWQNRLLLGRLLLNTNNIHPAGNAGFNEIDISPLCPLSAYVIFLKIQTLLLSDMVSINYWNSITIAWPLSEKLAILFFSPSKGLYFWSHDVHIHEIPTGDGKTLKYRISTKSVHEFRRTFIYTDGRHSRDH